MIGAVCGYASSSSSSLPSPFLSTPHLQRFKHLRHHRSSSPSSLSSSSSSSHRLRLHGNGSFRFDADAIKPHRSLSKVSCVLISRNDEVTSNSWDSLVLRNERLVLVEFYASWCGPCRMVHRIVDELAIEYGSKVKCLVLDTDNNMHVADHYDIKVVPMVLIFKDGEKMDSITGTMPKEFYMDAIEKALIA